MDDPRNRTLSALEVLLSVALLVAGLAGLVGATTTPLLLLVGWTFLAAKRRRWSDVGLARPASWGRTLALGIGGGLVLQAASLRLIEPVLERLFGQPVDLSSFERVIGDRGQLALGIVASWSLAAFGEELVFRGTLWRALGEWVGTARSPVVSLLLVNTIFGLGHLYQGPTGVVGTLLLGLAFAALYRLAGKNLWAPILAHGVFDSIAFVLLYLGVGGQP